MKVENYDIPENLKELGAEETITTNPIHTCLYSTGQEKTEISPLINTLFMGNSWIKHPVKHMSMAQFWRVQMFIDYSPSEDWHQENKW